MSTAPALACKKVGLIASFLQTDEIVRNFKFPRIHLPNLPGYTGKDYAEIGEMLGKTIPVVVAPGNIAGAKAFYNLHGDELNLTEQTSQLVTTEHWSTIVHEATHIIQDKKKWRMTKAEMEADAHFAQALFLHIRESHMNTGYMPSFDLAAKAFHARNKREFKDKCPLMLAEVGSKYYGKPGYEDLYVKTRLDGISTKPRAGSSCPGG